ncbi:hypothetical protein K0M31_001250 [Melipona bicolor]|uniref:Uncharacterized protein n=1 Tax=Melipona bicolor TaxID=60889 RepID=A0AA40GFB8_9HYME|nr:hypothetical protein K0M31_001250 [Melipona bicolor]
MTEEDLLATAAFMITPPHCHYTSLSKLLPPHHWPEQDPTGLSRRRSLQFSQKLFPETVPSVPNWNNLHSSGKLLVFAEIPQAPVYCLGQACPTATYSRATIGLQN